jgi:TnpA family transposase
MLILFYDLATRDGRRCIEIRKAVPVDGGYLYASHKMTVYSCAYKTQTERQVAFTRAIEFSKQTNLEIRDYVDGKDRRAVWQ